ncbi:hypothetical protein AB0F46_42850 [Streptomyces sp. NPDC026665]|uniref:hypothetical protein n=1 Tax=Streptomyces sp. NPDC026665 TaxID=3154798 RepID=UPI0033EA2630
MNEPQYILAKFSDSKRAYIRVDPKNAHRKALVYLPSGVDPSVRAEVARILEKSEDSLTFTNAKTDSVKLEDGRVLTPSLDAKVNRAKGLVLQYLGNHEIINKSNNDQLRTLVHNQKVNFADRDEWKFMVAANARGTGNPETTEGITSSATFGERQIAMNAHNHSLPAIVHEMFHILESDKMLNRFDMPDGLAEGMAEFLTCRATGVDARTNIGGPSIDRIYRQDLDFVNRAVKSNVTSHGEIQAAYFYGNMDAIKGLVSSYRLETQNREKTSFFYGARKSQVDNSSIKKSAELQCAEKCTVSRDVKSASPQPSRSQKKDARISGSRR